MKRPTIADSLAAYHAALDATWPGDAAADDVRLVVLDCETTGLDPRRHRIVSIGAVGIAHGEIDLGDTFEVLLRVHFNTEATLVHGITRDQARAGLEESEAIARLLDYLGDGVLVGHHLGHDLAMLNAALARHGGGELRNRYIDTGDLTLLLQADGALDGQPPLAELSLDALCAHFEIDPHGRHTASGDAFLTALVCLRLLRLARRHGRRTLAALTERPVDSGRH